MNVLIIGSGGREHALAWKVAQDPRVEKIFVAPGNAGTALEPSARTSPSARSTSSAWPPSPPNRTCADHRRPGSAAGDRRGRSLPRRRPGASSARPQAAAQLEGSKAFTKDFLARHNIPTADYQNFTEVEPALAYLREEGRPDRHQGRRSGRRQGRDRRHDPRRSRSGGARHALRQRLRRGRLAGW